MYVQLVVQEDWWHREVLPFSLDPFPCKEIKVNGVEVSTQTCCLSTPHYKSSLTSASSQQACYIVVGGSLGSWKDMEETQLIDFLQYQ